MKTVAVAGTFDTKAKEFQYVISLLEKKGIRAYTIHTGVFEPKFKPDVSNEEIAERAGTDIVSLAAGRDRALATETLSRGMELLLPELYQKGKFDGILSMGGSGGTSLVTPAMRALPLGVPKVMVSTMASGNVEQYVGTSDELDMLTCPYVFDADQAKAMAEAGADILVAHMGLTTKGTIGAKTALTLDDCIPKIKEIIKAGREVNPDIMVICHGGPIAEPDDAAYIIKNIPEIDGFFGASSIERFAAERGITAQAAAFKAITK